MIEAKGLAGKDLSMIGSRKSDPFTTLSLEADHAKHSFRTDTIAKTVDPKWEMMVRIERMNIKYTEPFSMYFGHT